MVVYWNPQLCSECENFVAVGRSVCEGGVLKFESFEKSSLFSATQRHSATTFA